MSMEFARHIADFAQNFMNDPNGMFVDAKGTWHLYYQYDATGIVAGNQHWGHAVS